MVKSIIDGDSATCLRSMDAVVMQAYERLVPADQLVVDATIVSLYKKDKEIRALVAGIVQQLDAKKDR